MATMLRSPRVETPRIQKTPAAPPRPQHDWRSALPVLRSERIELRQVEARDAEALFTVFGDADVNRFVSAPPKSAAGFERFITETYRQQVAGAALCYVVTRREQGDVIGVLQLRQLEPGFRIAEWGFAFAASSWGTGLFAEAAALLLSFAFERIGVQRLEARVVTRNGRGMRALQKLGAVQEGLLRRSFQREGVEYDQALYAILADEWPLSHALSSRMVH